MHFLKSKLTLQYLCFKLNDVNHAFQMCTENSTAAFGNSDPKLLRDEQTGNLLGGESCNESFYFASWRTTVIQV